MDLPDTLTLQAPLTIENITNINSGDDTLTTLTAGTYAFTMVDGGSFGFAAISGSDLTFDGTLPGGRFGGGEQVQLTGTDEAAKVTFVNIGRSDYYYDLPLMSGFETLALDGAYLEADGSDIFKGQLDGVTAVELQNSGLELNAARRDRNTVRQWRTAPGRGRDFDGHQRCHRQLPAARIYRH